MTRLRGWLLIFGIFSLTGCASVVATPSPIPIIIITYTKQITLPSATKYPTSTPIPCPPRLDTILPNPDIPENYIGMVFRLSYPEGLKLEFENSILENNERGTNYLLALAINQNTGQKIFWLERELCTDSQRHTFYEIIDTLALTYDLEHQEIVSSNSCWLNGVFNPEIVALGDLLPYSEKLQNISQAWKANQQTEKIEEISIAGIECNRYSGIRAP